jgi:peptidoglycan/xylan/chitin deacetylase (PgdA/CDA1 family)
MADQPRVEVAPWKHDAPFVYSITYDEATLDVLVNVYPLHQEYGIPGHVCAVSGYLGSERLRRGTSMRDVFHLSAVQLRFLMARGWTVSSHSHSHPPTNQEGLDLDLEVRVSREELEAALGAPVRLFTHWNDLRLRERILPLARQAGYLGALSIGYPLNPPEFDAWDIGRGTLGRDLEGWLQEPLATVYRHTRDAFPGQLTRAATQGRWLVDLTHIVAERLPPACPPSLWNRCVTPAILAARLAEVRALWGDRVWAAVPEEVLDYARLRRAASVSLEPAGPEGLLCRVSLQAVPAGLQCRELTLRARVPWPSARVDGGRVPSAVREGWLVWTCEVADQACFALRP